MKAVVVAEMARRLEQIQGGALRLLWLWLDLGFFRVCTVISARFK